MVLYLAISAVSVSHTYIHTGMHVQVGLFCGSVVKNLPAVQESQETQIHSLDWEDPLEKDMATRFSILAQNIPGTEEPGGLQSKVSQSDMTD